jgi:hypothetical protein
MIAPMMIAVKYSVLRVLAGSLLLLLLLWNLSAQAIVVPGLYQATIALNSRESEQERRRAFGEALQEVLTRISGLEASGNSASIRRAMANPEPYVESWSTQTRSNTINPDGSVNPQQRIEIVVNFYETEINRLLDENNIAVWPANRPETLVWVLVEDELEGRRMLGSSDLNNNTTLASLRYLAERRGLPLLFPLLDLEDQLRLNAIRLSEMDEAAILNASQRYQAESILALRLHRSLSGELLARAMYFFRDNTFSFEQFDINETDFLRGSINLATNELSQYYVVLLSGTEDSVKVNLQVDGIDSPAAYAALLSYLNTLEGVSSFQLSQAVNGSLYLQLQTGGQLRQLVETMALQRALQSVTELTREGEEVNMHYRWVSN